MSRITPPHPASFETARVWCPDCRRSIDCHPVYAAAAIQGLASCEPCPYCGSRAPKLERDPMIPPNPNPVEYDGDPRTGWRPQ